MPDSSAPKERYIIEAIKVGNSVKVSAICPKTGLEAAIICPAHRFNRKDAEKIAVNKLEYIKKKKAQEDLI